MNTERPPLHHGFPRSRCQQIISSTVCCTCIAVTKWCRWCAGELSRHLLLPRSAGAGAAMPSLEELGTKPLTASFGRGALGQAWEGGVTSSLWIGSCHFPVALAGREACWSLLCQTSGTCAFPGCPVPLLPGMGSLPVPSPLSCLLLNNRTEKGAIFLH